MKGQTPIMRQYFEAKVGREDVLLAMRVGDFYEFYGPDAETAARELDIVLTGREDGANGRVPMAGVPFHSLERYLARLVAKGHKVAVCEQLEDPKKAKGLVKRGVTRVYTPGTLLEDSMLETGANSFLASICFHDGKAGLACLDPSTGELIVTEIEGPGLNERILQELARIRPAELLADDDAQDVAKVASEGLGLAVSRKRRPKPEHAAGSLLKQFDVASLAGFGIETKPCATVAASMVVEYARANGLALGHVTGISCYSVDGFVRLDPSTRRSLELTQNMSDGGKAHTLLDALDSTVTSMGSRLLRRWIEQPLLDRGAIESRLDAVGRLVAHAVSRAELRAALKKFGDIERLVARACAGVATPRDLAALRASLDAAPDLDEGLRKVALGRLSDLRRGLGDHSGLAHQLRMALVDDPPPLLRDGGVIKDGFDLELDKLRDLARSGKDYIARLESAERSATGIDKLKVGFNSVFGYYLEVPKSQAARVPGHYVRKQTTANAERYITAELKDHESAVLGAEEKAQALESDIFHRLRSVVASQARALLQTARSVAEADVLASFAETAAFRGYARPEIVDDDVLIAREARHPVVELSGPFVPNDVELDEDRRVVVLTGPNMSGKSTYLRQTALLAVMAQMGSFVPAKELRIGLCDRIFTRVGAKDELALGQSTFMVEMIESANILNNATPRSLVVLDEVGRGTSTFDGLAIAWAMAEDLAARRSKTLFATHYHQLNELAEQAAGVVNMRVAVEEIGDRVVWTHRVVPGGADRSYGIQVARMAGVPPSVLKRAAEILARLEEEGRGQVAVPVSLATVQMKLFEAEEPEVVRELAALDLTRITPIEALLKLDEWKKRFGAV
jgi:DNA mismatch repair protein MutS